MLNYLLCDCIKRFFYKWKSFAPRGNEHLQNVVSVYGVKRIYFIVSVWPVIFSTCFAVGDIVIREKLHLLVHISVTKNSEKHAYSQLTSINIKTISI